MRFGTICSGIGAPEVAWHALGWQSVFASEIEAFPRAVLRHHWPGTALHGDFTTIKGNEYGPVDVLCGGTPCQSFSVAGLRGGLADERGNLALEFLRLADRLRPRWVVWENVPGVLSSAGGRDFGAFLGGLAECGYGWAYRVLDVQHFGLAQRRKRVFVVGYLGDWRPAAAVLFEPASLRGDPAPRREKGERVAPTVARGSPGGRAYGLDADTADSLIAGTLTASGKAAGSATQQDAECGLLIPQVATSLRARDAKGSPDSDCTATLIAYGCNNTSGPIDVAGALNASHTASGRQDFETETFVVEVAGPLRAHHGNPQGQDAWTGNIVAHALRAEGFDASEDGTGRGTPLVPVAFMSNASGANFTAAHDMTPTLRIGGDGGNAMAMSLGAAVRRLTPRECERLQGFPDDYTLIPYRNGIAADGPRYKALGNSMAVPVMRWIGARIARVDAAVRWTEAA